MIYDLSGLNPLSNDTTAPSPPIPTKQAPASDQPVGEQQSTFELAQGTDW